jgi:membrane protease YdiL (CAAX protease family)
MNWTGSKVKLLRAAQMVLVLLVGFAFSIYNSLSIFLNKAQTFTPQNTDPFVLKVSFILSTVLELVGLAVLFFILRRQRRSLSELGFNFRWRDIPQGVLLALVALFASYLFRLAMFYGGYFMTGRAPDVSPKNVYFLQAGVIFPLLLYTFVNAFNEELLARAYTITEVEYLTGGTVTAVLFSVLLQTSYHLYQGLPSALSVAISFVVFSLYYVKRRRVMPVILAHLYLDLFAVLAYAMR